MPCPMSDVVPSWGASSSLCVVVWGLAPGAHWRRRVQPGWRSTFDHHNDHLNGDPEINNLCCDCHDLRNGDNANSCNSNSNGNSNDEYYDRPQAAAEKDCIDHIPDFVDFVNITGFAHVVEVDPGENNSRHYCAQGNFGIDGGKGDGRGCIPLLRPTSHRET
jgi:hypothetical protein